MTIPEKYDRMPTGVISGFFLPFLIGITVFMFSASKYSLHSYIARIIQSDITTHAITLCVFPNVFLFLLFNHFDMLRASRGVLGTTIFWAIVVFGLKFLS